MTKEQKLVWKLIDQSISAEEFEKLNHLMLENPDLREYYQSCLETEFLLNRAAASTRLKNRIFSELKTMVLSWGARPTVTGVAGVIVGILATTLVYSSVPPISGVKDDEVIPIVRNAFEDMSDLLKRGFPSAPGEWVHQGDNKVHSPALVAPLEGDCVLRMEATNRLMSFSYYLIDLEHYPDIQSASDLSLLVEASFRPDGALMNRRYSIRIAGFLEPPSEIGAIWADESALFEKALMHIGRTGRSKNDDRWETLSAEMKIPAETRTIVVGLGSGTRALNSLSASTYVDDIAISLVKE